MKEPGSFSMHGSFGGTRPFVEIQDELIAAGHDVVLDEGGMGALFLRAADCEGLLTSRRLGAVAMPILYLSGIFDGPLHDLWSVLMFGKDGDEHRRLRGVVAGFFTPSGVEHWRPEVERIAGELAGSLPDDTPFDLWEAFALPLAASATCHTVGIPPADGAEIATGWALDLVQTFGVLPPEARFQAEKAAVAFTAYLDGFLAGKEQAPADDIASAVVGEAGRALTYERTARPRRQSHVRRIGRPGQGHDHRRVPPRDPRAVGRARQRSRVGRSGHRRTPALLPAHRAPSPGPSSSRQRCAGVEIKPGQVVLPSLRSACRDPELFERPDELDLHRKPGRQFAFGAGPHCCLGANLARLVVPVALSTLSRRFPALHLAGAEGEVSWGGTPFYGAEHMLFRT